MANRTLTNWLVAHDVMEWLMLPIAFVFVIWEMHVSQGRASVLTR